MKIYFATTNQAKVKTLQRDLSKYNISVIQRSIDLIEPRSYDVQEIASSKIKQAYPQIKEPTIVVDAGFYIDELNGFPKAFVNFALETIGIDGILRLIDGKNRDCEFRECLAYMDQSLKEPEYIITHVRGQLAENPRGVMQNHLWSKLSLIFIPKGTEKTLAEMSHNEYLKWQEILNKENSLGKKLYDWISIYKK